MLLQLGVLRCLFVACLSFCFFVLHVCSLFLFNGLFFKSGCYTHWSLPTILTASAFFSLRNLLLYPVLLGFVDFLFPSSDYLAFSRRLRPIRPLTLALSRSTTALKIRILASRHSISCGRRLFEWVKETGECFSIAYHSTILVRLLFTHCVLRIF